MSTADNSKGRRFLLYLIFYWPGAALADFGDWWHQLGNRGPWAL